MADDVIVPPPEPAVKNYGYLEGAGDDLMDDVDEPDSVPPVDPPAPEPPKPTDPPAPAPEPPKPTDPPTPAPEPPKPADVTPTDWKTALKAVDKYEALKELGYDDWTIDLLRYKEKTGDLTPYVQAKSVDYTKMTPEQLMRTKLQKETEGMSEKAFNFKYNEEVSKKYYLNRADYPDGSEEAEYGQEQLRLDGDKIRKEFIEEQKKFKAPEPTPDLDATKKEADLQQRKATLGDAVMNNEATKSLKANKFITYGEGKDSFNYQVEKIEPLINTALNTILGSDKTDLKDVDLNVFYKTLAYGANPAAFEKALIEHGRTLAKDELQKELSNIKPPEGDGSPAPDPQLTGAQQLARYGKVA